jgi:hypothetical protein
MTVTPIQAQVMFTKSTACTIIKTATSTPSQRQTIKDASRLAVVTIRATLSLTLEATTAVLAT